MNEIINLVTQKTGISEDAANKAVATVFDYLKDKLPAPLAGQLEALLSNQTPMASAKDAVSNVATMMDTKNIA
jgi:uncharacterized protein (DUF2267 family)